MPHARSYTFCGDGSKNGNVTADCFFNQPVAKKTGSEVRYSTESSLKAYKTASQGATYPTEVRTNDSSQPSHVFVSRFMDSQHRVHVRATMLMWMTYAQFVLCRSSTRNAMGRCCLLCTSQILDDLYNGLSVLQEFSWVIECFVRQF